MKRITLIPLALSVCFVTPANALRGVEPGAKCEVVRPIEARLGSTVKGAGLPRGTTDPRMTFFDGTHLGRPAIISYQCEAGVITFQMITARFSNEQEAQVAFSDFSDALIAEFGTPSRDLDEPAVSQVREQIPSTGGGPLQRLTTWVTEHRVLNLMLSGEQDRWEIVLAGP